MTRVDLGLKTRRCKVVYSPFKLKSDDLIYMNGMLMREGQYNDYTFKDNRLKFRMDRWNRIGVTDLVSIIRI